MKTSMNAFENWQVILGIIQVTLLLSTSLAAIYIGLKQNEINDRLRTLQDYVSVSAVPDQSGKIKLINTGKTNVYLWGFDIPGNKLLFEKPRLIPAGTMESSYYWIDPPVPQDTTKNFVFDFKLYLSDEFEEKWISENGGEMSTTAIDQNGKFVPGFNMKVWSYKTYKSEWQIQ
jgi:hypothetical protein